MATRMSAGEIAALETLPVVIPEYESTAQSKGSDPFSTGLPIKKYRVDDLKKARDEKTPRTHWFEQHLLAIWKAIEKPVPYAFRTHDGVVRSLDAGCLGYLLNLSKPELRTICDDDDYIIGVEPLDRLARRYLDIEYRLLAAVRPSSGDYVIDQTSTRNQQLLDELERRRVLWDELKAHGLMDLDPQDLRALGVYGGQQGIWVDKNRTANVSEDGNGVAVALLHTGRHYADELAEDGLTYHYPRTKRPATRDASEVEATKNAGRLELPVFVVLQADSDPTKRAVRMGWVKDWDDKSEEFLVLFGEEPPHYNPPKSLSETFTLTDEASTRTTEVKTRPGQQQFRYNVRNKMGGKCAVCSIQHPRLINAAHIRGKREKGSDDWRNGMPLCANHHSAYDAHLFRIVPETLHTELRPGLTHAEIALDETVSFAGKDRPHPDALQWRFDKTAAEWARIGL